METYIVRYYRNDGEWHDASYDRCPTFVFNAESDRQAKELALSYIAANQRAGEDFYLKEVARFELKTEAVTVSDNDRESYLGKVSRKLPSVAKI